MYPTQYQKPLRSVKRGILPMGRWILFVQQHLCELIVAAKTKLTHKKLESHQYQLFLPARILAERRVPRSNLIVPSGSSPKHRRDRRRPSTYAEPNTLSSSMTPRVCRLCTGAGSRVRRPDRFCFRRVWWCAIVSVASSDEAGGPTSRPSSSSSTISNGPVRLSSDESSSDTSAARGGCL